MVNVDHPLRFMVECFMLMVNSLRFDGQLRQFDLVGAQSSGLGAYHPPSHPGQDFEKLLSDQAKGPGARGQGPGGQDHPCHFVARNSWGLWQELALNILNILAYCQTNLELM